jgi:cysteine-rich repeat protein
MVESFDDAGLPTEGIGVLNNAAEASTIQVDGDGRQVRTTVSFASSDFGRFVEGTKATITLVRAGDLDEAVSVVLFTMEPVLAGWGATTLAAQNGVGATSGDVNYLSVTAQFASGQAAWSTAVDLLDDGIECDSNESLGFSIHSASSNAHIGPISAASLTIDDPPCCGDGIVSLDEACDDANFEQDDGCDNCLVEPGWNCTSQCSKTVHGLVGIISFELPATVSIERFAVVIVDGLRKMLATVLDVSLPQVHLKVNTVRLSSPPQNATYFIEAPSSSAAELLRQQLEASPLSLLGSTFNAHLRRFDLVGVMLSAITGEVAVRTITASGDIQEPVSSASAAPPNPAAPPSPAPVESDWQSVDGGGGDGPQSRGTIVAVIIALVVVGLAIGALAARRWSKRPAREPEVQGEPALEVAVPDAPVPSPAPLMPPPPEVQPISIPSAAHAMEAARQPPSPVPDNVMQSPRLDIIITQRGMIIEL